MKQIKTLILAFALFAGTQLSIAQSKVAHVDVSALMKDYPAWKTAQTQLETIQKKYDAEYNTMVQEYQTKMKKYQEDADNGTATESMNETRAKEMQDMGVRIQQYSENAKKELEAKQMELLKPLMEKVNTAIQKVAKAKGYEYVLDNTPGSGLLLANGFDLLADVKKELGF